MDIAVAETNGSYPTEAPFHPHVNYPEYKKQNLSAEPNHAYEGVREVFRLLGYDKDNFDTPDWNPFKNIVSPGDTVFVKPNFVDHKHRFDGERWSVITHPSVIRAVCDYIAIALQGKGKIIIGDNPHVDAKFDIIREVCALDALKALYKNEYGIECEILDLRFFHTPDLKYYGFKEGREALTGDPQGVTKVDIGNKSRLCEINPWILRGTLTDRKETVQHHIFGKHEYFFSKSIYDADVYVSIPKLKSHAKVGATLNIKGLIGTIANKNSLVHWRIGYPRFGGDEYPTPNKMGDYFRLYWQHILTDLVPAKLYFSLRNFLNQTTFGKAYNDFIRTEYQEQRILRGAWEGNDTIWRMTVDVFNAFMLGDETTPKLKGGRKTFSVIDGITAGEGNGPHFPDPKQANCIVAGESLLGTDIVSVRLMDFDHSKIRYLCELLKEWGQRQNNAADCCRVLQPPKYV